MVDKIKLSFYFDRERDNANAIVLYNVHISPRFIQYMCAYKLKLNGFFRFRYIANNVKIFTFDIRLKHLSGYMQINFTIFSLLAER